MSSTAARSDVLTVDVEDYYHVEAFSDRISPLSWPNFPPRVVANTERALQLFEEFHARATFFVLGWVAERNGQLIRDIAEAGHEVACHSYSHRRVTSLTPDEFREDLRRARGTIEDVAGVRVIGYRAPTFSIGRNNLWALDILAEEGFLYDSSIFPVRHDLYGYPDGPRFPHLLDLKEGRKLFEIPMTTVRVGGLNWPVGGGGYLRLLPMQYTRWAIRRVREAENQSVIVYFHPWELDPDQPRIEATWKSTLRHYIGLKSMEKRLREVVSAGAFGPMIDLVRQLDSSSSASIRPPAIAASTELR